MAAISHVIFLSLTKQLKLSNCLLYACFIAFVKLSRWYISGEIPSCDCIFSYKHSLKSWVAVLCWFDVLCGNTKLSLTTKTLHCMILCKSSLISHTLCYWIITLYSDSKRTFNVFRCLSVMRSILASSNKLTLNWSITSAAGFSRFPV